MLEQLKKELDSLEDKEQKETIKNFFKTGKGEYAEKDIFLGISVPIQRKISKKYLNLSLSKIKELLKSKIHEHRFTALLILINKYERGNTNEKENIFNLYMNHARYVNNWDLVDLSAPKIVGDFLKDKDKKILYNFSNSENLWEKRISIVSTFSFIKNNEFEDTLTISEILLNDSHDLIQKAVGWMLREVGKKDETILKNFLKFHHKKMPRTTLRYAIEKFDEKKRKKYLLQSI